MRVRFGPCVFDTGTRQLVRSGQPLALSPKAFDLLTILLEARPQAVSRQALHDRLWPRTFVSHTSLARVVNEVRKAIGDAARNGRFVRTVHSFGYAFSGEAADTGAVPPSTAGAGLLWSGRMIGLVQGETLIGRGPDCAVRVPSSRVSRHHARITVVGPEAVLQDLGSKNGTFVRGRRIEEPTRLAHGDDISVGPAVLVYSAPPAAGSTETGTG